MKKVTLLGDSMRLIGYGLQVPQMLGEDFTVYQPDENCRYVKYSLHGIQTTWAAGIAGSDIIHWNNGVWDTCDWGDGIFSTPEEYAANMVRVAKILQQQAKTVIFATTMPVNEAYPHSNNQRIVAFNSLIVPKLEEMGIIINDLYSLVLPHRDRYLRTDDNIHLTKEGIRVCAEQVTRYIKAAAED